MRLLEEQPMTAALTLLGLCIAIERFWT